MKTSHLFIATTLTTVLLATNSYAHNKHKGHIKAPISTTVATEFDIVHAKVITQGSHLIFQQAVSGEIGNKKPKKMAN